jgi:hypothetical protein
MYSELLISNIINTHGKNKITEAISYQLSSLSEIDINIISIVNTIQDTLNIKCTENYNLINIIIALIYMYNSQIMLYNLPHMLDNINYNNKPSIHIFLGETITQLTSIALLTECFNIIGKDCDEYNKYKNSIILSNNSQIDNKTLIAINNNENIKEHLQKLLKLSQKDIYHKAVSLSLDYYTITHELEKEITEELKNKFDF